MKNKTTKLSRLQKIILMYMKILIVKNKNKYLKRVDFTNKLKKFLGKESNISFNNVLSKSLRSLEQRGLLSRRYNSISLNIDGWIEAGNATKEFKNIFKIINEKNVRMYYNKLCIVKKDK